MGLERSCKHWHNLSIEERGVIDNEEDCPIISVIDGLSYDFLERVYHSLELKKFFFKEYLKEEKKWGEKNKYLWGAEHHKNPSICSDYVQDFIDSRLPQRFRLYYAAKNPNRFEKNFNEETKLFFSEVYFASEGEFGKRFSERNI